MFCVRTTCAAQGKTRRFLGKDLAVVTLEQLAAYIGERFKEGTKLLLV